jgi:phage tail sheath gpL-like
MIISPSSLAAGNFVGLQNEQYAVSAGVLAQKNIIIGTFDEATFTLLAPNVPFRVYSPEDVGGKTGFGSMLHRLAKAVFKPGSAETWVIPQLEGGSDPAIAAGVLNFSASALVKAGTIYLYIAGDLVRVTVADADSGTVIGEAVEQAINDNDDLPVIALNAAGVVAITSKSGGDWGNDISLLIGNENNPDTVLLPSGVACTITAMTGGAGVPDIQDALDALGTGDAQNEDFFTNLIHGYGDDTATLNAISTYNGAGNSFVGNYKKEVARPFRSLCGNVAKGSAGLNAALAFAELRRETDRTNGMICVPGSPNHPAEIAAQVLGDAAILHSTYPQVGQIDRPLDGVWPGLKADRWTNDFDSRDIAVKGGLATTIVRSGTVYMQNIDTFFRPVSISASSNYFRQMKNISIAQNVLANWKQNFSGLKWTGIFICEDITAIVDATAKLKARDVKTVMDDVIALIDAFVGLGWIYQGTWSKSKFTVSLRAGLTGFNIYCPLIPSGEGGIFNTTIGMDTSIAILLQGGN